MEYKLHYSYNKVLVVRKKERKSERERECVWESVAKAEQQEEIK